MKELLRGDLSVPERIWTAGAPALVLIAYVVVGLVVYRIRNLTRGPWRDAEAEGRVGGGLTVRPIRVFFTWLVRPWVDLLVRLEVPPNAITSLSLALSLAAGVALAMGRFALGGWLYVGAGLCDFLDGSVARRSGRATPGGAVLDSVLDRYTEGAILVGLAWFYRDRWVLAPVLAALTGSMLVPYVRARGEAIGAKLSDVGFMQRPERVVILCATISLSPIVEALLVPGDPRPLHRVAVAGILLLAVGTHLTAATRTRHLVRSLDPSPSEPVRRPARPSSWPLVARLAGDFGVFYLITSWTPASLPVATMAAYAVGATLSLLLLGLWAQSPVPNGGAGLSWWLFALGSSAALCGGGTAVLSLVPGLSDPLVWLAVRLVVFFAWTRPLLAEGPLARLRLQGASRGLEGG